MEITELSGTSDEPSIPEAYQKYLAYGSAETFLQRQKFFSQATEMGKEKELILQRAIVFYDLRNEDIQYQLTGQLGTDDGE